MPKISNKNKKAVRDSGPYIKYNSPFFLTGFLFFRKLTPDEKIKNFHLAVK